jgi:hypothetical protein
MKNLALHIGHYAASVLWPSAFDPHRSTFSDPALSGHKPRARFAHAASLAVSVSLALLPFGAGQMQAATSVITFTSSGSWICPVGVTTVQVECLGGGGAGGAAKCGSSGHTCGGGGGGGGAYTIATELSVSIGTKYTVTVGDGGTSSGGTSTAGGASSVNTSTPVSANGGSAGTSIAVDDAYGAGGAGGAAGSFSGGTGAAATSSTGGGGGGSSAGNASNGNNGNGITGGTVPTGGGVGGNGKNNTSSGNGFSPTFGPGGGGGGAYAASTTQRNGAAGAAGQVVLTYTTPTYYSKASGDANTLANWNTARDGIGGSNPVDFTSGSIFVIQDGHNMTTSAGWSISGPGSKLWIESGGTLTANNAVMLAAAATFQIDGGGTYVHNNTSAYGSTIFQAGTKSLAATSTVILNNSNMTGPSGVTFGNLTVNFTSDPGGSVNCSGGITNINGNFTVISTSTREFRLTGSTAYMLTIAGNLMIQGGTLSVASASLMSSGTGIKLYGNYSQTAGTFTMTTVSSFAADFYFSSGGGPDSVTYTMAGAWTPGGKLNFLVDSGKTVTLNNNLETGPTNLRTLTVNGTLNCGANNVTGAGNFTLSGSATLGIGSTAGITATAGQGNIQVTGTRTYAAGANYVYNGTATQVTGDQLPATAHNLTIANTAGAVSLSGSGTVNGTLTVNSGANLDFNGHTVTVATAPVLNGALTMEVNKTGANAFTGSKLTQSAGTLTYGGTLTVTASGQALAGGDVIDLFDAGGFSGSFGTPTLSTPLPTETPALNWYTGNLTLDGTIIVNRAPQAQDISLGAQSGVKQTLQIIGSPKYAPTDLDGNTLTLSQVSYTSGHGATVNINDNGVEYTAPSTFTGPDSFAYTVSDGRGGTVTATVAVTVSAVVNQQTASISFNGSSVSVVFWGIPGVQYTIQRSTDNMVTWLDLTPGVTANDLSTQPYGQINFTDSSPPNTGSGFYRLKP